MRYFSYVVARDYGFAPNPFDGFCTLATCKPEIRKAASVGDWVFGTGSVVYGLRGKLVYAMRVNEKLTFNDYWKDKRFMVKRPIMNGSWKRIYGDNVYHHDGVNWYQADSHHSLSGGRVNEKNLKRDTKVDTVLISREFYYFGGNAVDIPEPIRNSIIKEGPGHRCPTIKAGNELIEYLEASFQQGYLYDPASFGRFERYSGPN